MISLRVDESRRLTGPNLFSNNPGAALEVYVEGVAVEEVVRLWQKHLEALLASLGIEAELYHRYFSGGVNLALSADEDRLYFACEVNEAAVELTRAELTGTRPDRALTSVEHLTQFLMQERNPALMELIRAANQQFTTYLVDEDSFSLGLGCNSQSWPLDALPDPRNLNWSLYQDIPVGLVTGTNGKSTSVRMCEAIISAEGLTAGITSTDYIRAAGSILDYGDYSGPLGARTLLRDKRVEMAVLEVARGGMLRRGMGIKKASAVLLTNVADDHLGQFGINTVEELIEVKTLVTRALSADGTAVVNADDEGLVGYFQRQSESARNQIFWFSLNADNPCILEHQQVGKPCVWVEDGKIMLAENGHNTSIVAVADIPTTLQGAARHNIANSLGVTALCHAMGLSVESIARGLMSFRGDSQDNPGRGNYMDINGIRVLIDFAHNAHSLSAVIDTVSAIPANRKSIMLGHAGDRQDQDIINLTNVAASLAPDRIITAELPDYLRGRRVGEVPELIRQHCLDLGFAEQQLSYADNCLAGARLAMESAEPGDFILLLALDQREEILQYLESLQQN